MNREYCAATGDSCCFRGTLTSHAALAREKQNSRGTATKDT